MVNEAEIDAFWSKYTDALKSGMKGLKKKEKKKKTKAKKAGVKKWMASNECK